MGGGGVIVQMIHNWKGRKDDPLWEGWRDGEDNSLWEGWRDGEDDPLWERVERW